MQITSKYTIAIHILLCIDYFDGKKKVTSEFLASSVNTNPVIIRKILGKLKEAKIINIESGIGGATIIKDLSKVTMLDVFNIIKPLENDTLFNFHKNPNMECPIGNNIHNVLDKRLFNVENAMLKEMDKITIKELSNEVKNMKNNNLI